MILVNQQNFTTNLITDLLAYIVNGLQRVRVIPQVFEILSQETLFEY